MIFACRKSTVMTTDTVRSLTKRRFRAGFAVPGLGLLLALSGCASRSSDHPLAHVERVELCALLPSWQGAAMQQVRFASPEPGLAGVCNLIDTRGDLQLNLTLTSDRVLQGKAVTSTQRLFSMRRDEAAANGGVAPTVLNGDGWRQAISFHVGETRQMLIEDRGILLVLQSRTLPEAEIEAYGRRVAVALRKVDPVKASASSSAAANPRP